MSDVYIVSAKRTPVGKAPKGVFSKTRPDDLLAHVIKDCVSQVSQIDPKTIDDVIIGCAMPEGAQGMNVARIASLMAGLPENVSAMTVNRFCSSGLQTIATAAQSIMSGQCEVVLAGGVESMSQIPMGGFNYRANPAWFDQQEWTPMSYGMGITAEKVAAKYGITREAQDEFALSSHQKALDAQQKGGFSDEIANIEITNSYFDDTARELKHVKTLVSSDQGPRADTSLQVLNKLRPVFDAKGTVTAGNTSQMSDGAAALLLVSEKVLNQFDLQPLARLCSFQVAGVAPEYMGIGPVEAIPKALSQANLSLSDLSWIELNEAFAAQALAVMNECELDPTIVNPVGGAIALGHPLGATGAIRACSLIHGARQKNLRYGMVTMCIGTGMGAAGIFEIL